MKIALGRFVKWSYLICALLVIALAVAVQSGRSLSHLLGNYNDDIASYLSTKLNAQVSIDAIEANWDGLRPSLDVRNLRIANAANESLLAFENAQVRFDILRSIISRQFVWNSILLNDVQMDFVQRPDGKWQINGLPVSERLPKDANPTTSGVKVDTLIDMLLLSNRIEFLSSQLRFQFADEQKIVLNSPRLLLENSDDFHRLALTVDVDNNPDSVKLILEGRGDPRDSINFRSSGYLEINQFPTTEPLAATSAFLLHGVENSVIKGDGHLNARIWLDSHANGAGYQITGQLGLQRLQLPLPEHPLQLDDVSTDILGNWFLDGSWHLGLLRLQSNFQEQQLNEANLNLSFDKASAQLNVQSKSINLAELTGLLDVSGALGNGKLHKVITDLTPKGHLNDLLVKIPLTNASDWTLQANLEKVAVNNWQGVPKISGLDGYVEATAVGGFVTIDSRDEFSMHYIPIYQEPMVYQAVKGQVAWHLRKNEGRIYVNSGPLSFRQDNAELTGYMLLDLPWEQQPTVAGLTSKTSEISPADAQRVDLTLQISATQLPVGAYKTYVPQITSAALQEWLDEALGNNNPGVAKQVGLFYRGDLASKDPESRSIDLYIDTENTSLKFHPDWPELTGITTQVVIHNDKVDAWVKQGQLHTSTIDNTYVTLRPLSHTQGTVLSVKGSVAGPGSDALRVMREGHLREYMGNNIDSWELSGDMVTTIDVAIPIGVANEAQQKQLLDYSINTHLSEGVLALKNLNLHFTDLSGNLTYTNTDGFIDTQLHGILFERPVSATLISDVKGAIKKTLITTEGSVDAATLADWSNRPELKFFHGTMPFATDITLYHRPQVTDKSTLINGQLPQSVKQFSKQAFAKVSVKSDLNGVSVDLPGVLNKSANTTLPMELTLWLQESASQLVLDYGNVLYALMHVSRDENARLLNASVGLAEHPRFSDKPEFLVTGKLPYFDVELWKKALSQYAEFQDEVAETVAEEAGIRTVATPSVRQVAGLPFRARVELAKHAVGPLLLRNLLVEVVPINYGWNIRLANDIVAGYVNLPDSEFLPMEIQLDHLYLEEAYLTPPSHVAGAVHTKDTAKPLIAPQDLPAAKIAIERLYVGGKDFGNWSLLLKPNEKGVVIDDIQGSIRGLTVKGTEALNQEGARLIWNDGESGPQTRFIGSIHAKNIADVLKQWDKPEFLDSESARFNVDLNWTGPPAEFDLVNLFGTADLSLVKGRFHRNASAGEGLLRLMSVLNFDSIARRLRLDFSDLYQGGLAYDSITGKVALHGGVMRFTRPLDMKGPSSRLQLAGSVDLRNEEINSRLVATLPVAGNLTFAAALITGLPAAAGVYIVSKLFKKQVDRATSISYLITGGWDEPVVRFTRFFESEDSLFDVNLQPD